MTSFSFQEAFTLSVTHEQLKAAGRIKKNNNNHIALNTQGETQRLPHRAA